MAGVQVQYNSNSPAQLNALAFAKGNQIHLAPGQERHLPHEAWHLVQQAQGRVQPTTQAAGQLINDDHALEHEADTMGTKALTLGSSSIRGAAVQRLPAPRAGGMTKAPSGQHAVQRAWNQIAESMLEWDSPMGGLIWSFNQETRAMAFKLAKEESHYAPEVLNEQGVWRPYGEWQRMGWGIEGAPETPTAMVKKGDYQRSLESYVQTGTRRWEELQKAMQNGGGSLDRETQAARDWFFNEHYKTDRKPGDYDGDSQIESNYKFRPQSIEGMSGKGSYINRFEPAEGHIVADSNYALKSGEDYYNPRSGKAEGMSNSEILFQQWRLAAKESTKEVSKLRRVTRSHVSGTGLPMLTVIQNLLFGEGPKVDITLRPLDKYFLALLAIPNVVSSIWLLRDHGAELGIHTIASITIRKNKTLEINFSL